MLLRLLLLVSVLCSGCSYVATLRRQSWFSVRQLGVPRQRIYKHMLSQETFFVFGMINHLPETGGKVAVVALYDQLQTDEIVDVNWFSRSDSYFGLNLPAGTYRLLVAVDKNRDGRITDAEVVGGRLLTVDATTAPEHVLGDCDIDLRKRVTIGSTRFSVGVRATTASKSLFYPDGTIRSLEDPIFSRSMARMGLYAPAMFMEKAPMLFYALEEDSGYKIPVIFVHGISGTPLDFAPILEKLDRTRYRPWFFYYPSGQNLSQVSSMFYKIFLSGKVIPLGEMPLIIVAHSMGGVMVRESLNHCTGTKSENKVGCFISIASPFGGHPGAKYVQSAPVVIPSWGDMNPDGRFVQGLTRLKIPARHFLVCTTGGKPGDDPARGTDGTVPVSSQLNERVVRETAGVVSFRDSHEGVLHDPKVIAYLVARMDDVRSPFPDDHLVELRKGGYEPPADIKLTALEAHLIRNVGIYLDALAEGKIQPCHPLQTQFLEVCAGRRSPSLPAETAWVKVHRKQ